MIIWIEVIGEALVGRSGLCYGEGLGRGGALCYWARLLITGPSGFLPGLSGVGEEGQDPKTAGHRKGIFSGTLLGLFSTLYSCTRTLMYECSFITGVYKIECPDKVSSPFSCSQY